jgi:hypothetical protein
MEYRSGLSSSTPATGARLTSGTEESDTESRPQRTQRHTQVSARIACSRLNRALVSLASIAPIYTYRRVLLALDFVFIFTLLRSGYLLSRTAGESNCSFKHSTQSVKQNFARLGIHPLL